MAQGMRAAFSRRCRSRCGTSRASGGTATSALRASKLRKSPARTSSLLLLPLSKWRLPGCSVKRKVESESPLSETVSTNRRFLHAFLRSLGLFSTPSVFSSASCHTDASGFGGGVSVFCDRAHRGAAAARAGVVRAGAGRAMGHGDACAMPRAERRRGQQHGATDRVRRIWNLTE